MAEISLGLFQLHKYTKCASKLCFSMRSWKGHSCFFIFLFFCLNLFQVKSVWYCTVQWVCYGFLLTVNVKYSARLLLSEWEVVMFWSLCHLLSHVYLIRLVYTAKKCLRHKLGIELFSIFLYLSFFLFFFFFNILCMVRKYWFHSRVVLTDIFLEWKRIR